MLILPAFDEAERIALVLGAVVRAQTGCEIVVIDDGSRDDTAGVARAHGAAGPVLRHPFNLGYGAALQPATSTALSDAAPRCSCRWTPTASATIRPRSAR